MTYRTAKARLATVVEAIHDSNALFQPKLFGARYKHTAELSERANIPGASRLFFFEMGEAETVSGNYLAGYEWTRCDLRLSVWLSAAKAKSPAMFDDVVGTIYEEVRGPLLVVDNWDRPTSTIVCVEGPGEAANILFAREDVEDEDSQLLGAWLNFDLSLIHEEQGS